MTVNQSAFSSPAVWESDDTGERGGRIFRKRSSMASSNPFDYSQARKWAPKADISDPSTLYPSEVEHHGVRPQEEMLGLFGKYFALWQAKMPTSKKMQDAGRKNLLWGIFGTYQKDWRTPILPFAKNCQGGKLWDVDGNEYIDLQFGDTPSMFGHGAENPAVKAAAESLLKVGIDPMMGTEEQAVVGEELERHFKLPVWMHALTASDANRYLLSIARCVTGRRNIAIANFAYHGTIDETQKMMTEAGVISRYHEMPQYHGEVDHGTKIFIWNDLESLEECLKDETVAVVMIEPIMSNIGWVWPEPGWHEGVRALTRKHGTLLCYDETHTLGHAWNGSVGAQDLEFDMWSCGKAISSGIPGAVFGMTREIADLVEAWNDEADTFADAGLGFLGNALTGNTMSTTALRVTMQEVMTPQVFEPLLEKAGYVRKAMEDVFKKYDAPFRAEMIGNRLCYHFIPDQSFDPLTGITQIGFGGLFEFTHAYLWYHGLLIMPFFNMLLICPQHTQQDLDRFVTVFDEMISIVMGHSEG
ncbi:MAG: aminotransferase class III-fold pyridoxal phosphate-dependent enzyme [Deltaproteobacteria bacterium]|nr:aminotransferase class III-fold pyridoxal phosphate-dependent enzyme [Deltaproteobacteria bacterium]